MPSTDLADSNGTSLAAKKMMLTGDLSTPTKDLHRTAVRDFGIETPQGKREIRNKDFHHRVSLSIHSWAIMKHIDLQNTKLEKLHFEEISHHGVHNLNILRPTNTGKKLYDVYFNKEGSAKYERYVNDDNQHEYPDTCAFLLCKTFALVLKENCPMLEPGTSKGAADESIEYLKSRCDSLQEAFNTERKRNVALLQGMKNDDILVNDDSSKVFNCPFCNVTLRRFDTLKKHIKDYHPDEDSNEADKKEVLKDKKVACKYCSKILVQRSLYKHLQTCKLKIDFASPKDKRHGFCKICKQIKCNLSQHMETHATVKITIDVETQKKNQVSISKNLFNDVGGTETSQVNNTLRF